jgi:hypothetical protein
MKRGGGSAGEWLGAGRAFIAREGSEPPHRSSHMDAVEIVLAGIPQVRRSGRVPGRTNGSIHILRIHHGARRWPDTP